MRTACLIAVLCGVLGLVGAALVDRWEVWPDADWQPGPAQEQRESWLRGQPPPQPATPSCSFSVE